MSTSKHFKCPDCNTWFRHLYLLRVHQRAERKKELTKFFALKEIYGDDAPFRVPHHKIRQVFMLKYDRIYLSPEDEERREEGDGEKRGVL
jgi:hypothetical protein